MTPDSKPRTAAAAYRWRWAALTALLAGQAMGLLDATIVQVAAPTIHASLGGDVADIKWFSTAYTLPFAIFLITGGRLGDMIGRRRVFLLGVMAFLVASVACALAPSTGVLIGLRVVQGIAAAAFIPQAMGLTRAMFAGPELPRALGCIGPVMGLAAVCGPILGGLLIHADLLGMSWRTAFLINLPLGAAVLVLGRLLIEDHAPQRPAFDPGGTALVMLGTGVIVYTLNEAGGAWLSIRSLAGLGAGLAVLAAFGVHQRHRAAGGRESLVEPSLFASRGFPAALATSVLFFAVSTGLMLVVILELQLGLGASALTAGLTLLPWPIGMAVASWGASRYLVPRYGHRVLFAGLAVLLLGVLAAIAAYHAARPHAYPAPLLGALAVIGLGVGLFCSAFFTTALHRARPQEVGSAAGMLNAVQELGATLGIAIIGSAYLDVSGSGALRAAQAAFWITPGLLLAAALTGGLMTEPARHARRFPVATSKTPEPS
jgi:EmrB/QacA subfamily drug resistance transporter